MNARDLARPLQAGETDFDDLLRQAYGLRHEDTALALRLNTAAFAAAWAAGSVRGVAYAMLRMALCHVVLADAAEECTHQLQQAESLLRSLGDAAGEAEALNLQAHLCCRVCRYDQAIELRTRCVALRRRAGSRLEEAAALHNLAVDMRSMQRLADALELELSSLDIATELSDAGAQAYALVGVAGVLSDSGQPAAAIDHFERCLTLVASTRDRALECTIRTGLAETLLVLKQPESAQGQAERAVALARATGNRDDLALALVALGHAHLARANLPGARQVLDEAWSVQAPLDDATTRAHVRASMGRLAQLDGQLAQACAWLDEALASARQAGATGTASRCHEMLSRLHEQQGAVGAALMHLRAHHVCEEALRGRDVQQRVHSVLLHARLKPLRRETETLRRNVREMGAELEALRSPPR